MGPGFVQETGIATPAKWLAVRLPEKQAQGQANVRLASSSPSEAQVLQRRPTCAILYVTLTWETGYSFQETKSGRHFCVHLISDPQDPWVFPIEKDVRKGALHGHGWDGRCLLGERFMKVML